MSATPTYNDAGLEYGGAQITVTPKASASPTRTTLTTFVCLTDSQFEFATNSKVVDQMNQFGEYRGSFGIPLKREGSCDVQLPAGRRIYAGDTFVIDTTGNDFVTAGTTLFQITDASQVYENEMYRKQTIKYFIRKFALDNTAANPVAAA